jgi:hypothetical protein
VRLKGFQHQAGPGEAVHHISCHSAPSNSLAVISVPHGGQPASQDEGLQTSREHMESVDAIRMKILAEAGGLMMVLTLAKPDSPLHRIPGLRI